MVYHTGSDWSDEKIALLTKLWNEGHSTTTIGKMMGISRNAVIGKAHRIHLTPRPMIATIARARTIKAALKSEHHYQGKINQCAFITEDPHGQMGDPHLFCGKPTVPNKPYCQEHCDRVYAKAPERRFRLPPPKYPS